MARSDIAFEPVADRPYHRLTALYALDCTPSTGANSSSSADHLRLGRLERFYRDSDGQTPNVLHYVDYAGHDLELLRAAGRTQVERCRLWLFSLPYGGVVAGLSVDFSADMRGAIALLEDTYYTDMTIQASPLIDLCRNCHPNLRKALSQAKLASHTHQILFLAHRGEGMLPGRFRPRAESRRHDVLQRLVYRADLPYKPEYSQIRFPSEPNRRPGAVVAVSPYVTVVAGQQDYIENGMLLSAVQGVGSAHLVSRIRRDAYEALSDLRRFEREEARLGLRRGRLGSLSDVLSRQELELSFGVDAYESLGSLVPSQRLVEFHRVLFDALELPEESETTGKMLERLSGAISASHAAVKTIERKDDERRRLKWSLAIGFVSAIAIPLGIAFGFFGSSVAEVNRRASIFDWSQYHGLYLFIAGVLLSAVLIFAVTWLFTRFEQRRERRAVGYRT